MKERTFFFAAAGVDIKSRRAHKEAIKITNAIAKAASGEFAYQLVIAHELDWSNLRALEGGWDGAYAWAARTYDTLILLEMQNGMIAKGQFTMAERFFEAKKKVLAWRNGHIVAASRVSEYEGGDWVGGFGRLTVS